MSEDDSIQCIKHDHVDLLDTTWCGRKVNQFERCFLDIDHAAENGRQDGFLVACPKCAKAVYVALQNGFSHEPGGQQP